MQSSVSFDNSVLAEEQVRTDDDISVYTKRSRGVIFEKQYSLGQIDDDKASMPKLPHLSFYCLHEVYICS